MENGSRAAPTEGGHEGAPRIDEILLKLEDIVPEIDDGATRGGAPTFPMEELLLTLEDIVPDDGDGNLGDGADASTMEELLLKLKDIVPDDSDEKAHGAGKSQDGADTPTMEEILDNIRDIPSDKGDGASRDVAMAAASKSRKHDNIQAGFSNPRARPYRKRVTWKPLLLLAATTVILVSSFFYFSRSIVTTYPPLREIYNAFGGEDRILGAGLNIPGYAFKTKRVGGDRVITVTGEIRNTTRHVQEIPILRAIISNADGMVLHFWSFRAKKSRISGGGSVAYETTIRNPPVGGTILTITFTRTADFESEAEMEVDRVRARKTKTRGMK